MCIRDRIEGVSLRQCRRGACEKLYGGVESRLRQGAFARSAPRRSRPNFRGANDNCQSARKVAFTVESLKTKKPIHWAVDGLGVSFYLRRAGGGKRVDETSTAASVRVYLRAAAFESLSDLRVTSNGATERHFNFFPAC